MAEGEEDLTKRQRQKQRKQAKREAEKAEQRRQRMRRLASMGLLALLVLVALGAAAFFWQQTRAERGDLLAGEAEAAQAAGCQPEEQPADLGSDHLPGDPAALVDAPPAELYDHRPATSGPHLGVTAVTGVYDEHVDERLVLHNMEHGYVIVWWDPELPEDQAAEIQEWAEGAMGDAQDHLIAAPYHEALPDGGNVGFVAWGHRQLCDEFSADVADAFVDAHADNLYSGHPATDATREGEGLMPGQDPVVFPPLEDMPELEEPEDALDDDEDESDDED